MVFAAVLQRFVNDAPVCVMATGLLESVFAPGKLDALFGPQAVSQYQRRLLFSTCVEVMAEVVCRIRPSANAAYTYRLGHGPVPTSLKALHDKPAHVEPAAAAAPAPQAAKEVALALGHLRPDRPAPLPGHDPRVLDGNHPQGAERRLGVLRDVGAAALPGGRVRVLNPRTGLLEDAVLSEGGHAQECVLALPLLGKVGNGQAWLGDRRCCTSGWLFGLARREAFFLNRQHIGRLRWRLAGGRLPRGRCAAGAAHEQGAILTGPDTHEEMTARRITLALDGPTQDGERGTHLLTNAPGEDATAVQLAESHLGRWQLGGVFHGLTTCLKREPNTLGYPRAALLAFCVTMACYSLLAACNEAVGAVHGREAADGMSRYYVADGLSGTYRGLRVATEQEDWAVLRQADAGTLAGLLVQVAQGMKSGKYKKSSRGPKKKKGHKKAPRKHSSTHQLLNPDLFPQKKQNRQ
jgi:hypothetical protein